MQHSIQIQKQEINKILEIISTNKITMKIFSFYYRIINIISYRITKKNQQNHQKRIFIQSIACPVLSYPFILKNRSSFPIYNCSKIPFVVQDSRTSYPLLKTISVLRNRKANRVQSGGTLFPSKVIP